jgi:hypothetical protein
VLAYIHRDLVLEFRQVRAFCLREATSLINPTRDRVVGVGSRHLAHARKSRFLK